MNKLQIKYIVVVAILIIGIIYWVTYPSELEKICEPKDLENVYGFSEEEFLAYSLMEKVSSMMQFIPENRRIENEIFSWEDIKGDCNEYAITLSKCLGEYGIENRIVRVSKPDNSSNHVFNQVMINGLWRTLDSTNDIYNRYTLFSKQKSNLNFFGELNLNPNMSVRVDIGSFEEWVRE